MTVLSGRAAGAAAALGSACWVSTLVFDRVGTGAGARVAFLSSWQELVGLSVFAFLVLLLGKALVERALVMEGGERAIPTDLLFPVGALAVLALPYLPYLADAIPALDALAGPGRFIVWAVVIAQVGWATVGVVGSAWRGDRPPLSSRAGMLIIGAASLAVFLACAARLGKGPIYPGGDEPHYLVVTQSLLRDHDLAIANNHERGDYREYYAGVLKPDYRVTGRDGQIYSIHPVGLSVLIAPAFALGGYWGAAVFVALLAALAVTMAWRWAAQVTGSNEAATVGWLAVALCAPFVLHSFAIYPECAAAVAIVIALGPTLVRANASLADALVRGIALGMLPWLGAKYAPMSAVGWCLVAWRLPRRNAVALVVPYATAILLWLGFFWWLYGSPSPAAPYGAAHQMSLSNLAAGLPGLFADQEYGAIAVAPALALGVVGAWRLARSAQGRWVVLAALGPLAALALTTGAFALWWGGSAPPGRELVAALPLLAPLVAWLWHTSAGKPVERAALEWLVIVGAAVTAALVIVHGGLLIANGRDGSSDLLEFLDAGGYLVRAAPSFIAHRDQVAVPLATAALWIVVAAGGWFIAGKIRAATRGVAQLSASLLGAAALVLAAALVPAVQGRWLPPPIPVESQLSTGLLDRFDARARPLAIVYAPFGFMSPEDALSDVTFVASPGLHTAPQPIHVLMNARLSLPAGSYSATLYPAASERLSGTVGLQVGRLGPPLTSWPVDGQSPASLRFALDMDAGFVGFRAAPDTEREVARLEVRPVSIVSAGERTHRPAVLAAAEYGAFRFYFHDDRVYLEPDGFWTKGKTTIALTVVPRDPSTEGPSVTLRIHGGQHVAVPLTLTTPAWSTHLEIPAGVTREVAVPSRPDLQMLPLTLHVDSGFVPAEDGGPGDDRRWLGCWVQVGENRK